MDLPWHFGEAKATPPWIRHSRLQTQQEICAKRFLRFASQRTVHLVLVLWALASWRGGLGSLFSWAPLLYFTGPVLLKHRVLPTLSVEHLSVFILALNAANALHLAMFLAYQGTLLLASPLFASVTLCRLLFGLFTQEVHLHVLLSSSVTFVALSHATGGTLTVVSCLLLEITAVAIFSGGPSGYEEAMVHLAQLRLQHQLARSQALQRIDVEREELSGQLLSIASEGIAELTASVQRASEPVLNMLKSSCATGTKSAAEAERIGRIGQALQAEVAELLRHRTQATWQRLQERAKERVEQLEGYSLEQEAIREAILKSLQKGIGRSLAEIHKLEMEAEISLTQLVQSEAQRAMEIAEARMDLVWQSSEAMERRVSDTVEVLLSLLKYFRSKGSCEARDKPMRPIRSV
ncbi:Pentatricopeptide repeat-containing protein [Durusdinium trenchii]|uniref:Chloroplastic n=1 Tax=Durusdinium trenchii TaxID=1381693 RepID=A0ABP0LQ13_9DINO